MPFTFRRGYLSGRVLAACLPRSACRHLTHAISGLTMRGRAKGSQPTGFIWLVLTQQCRGSRGSSGLEELLRARQRLGQTVRADNDSAAIAPRLDPENQLAVLDSRETEELVAHPELGGAVLRLLRAKRR
jgi:hypothetical protein